MQLIIKLPDDLHYSLKVLAAARKSNMTQLIIRLITKEIEKEQGK
jgi:predicted transcriptional regulator